MSSLAAEIAINPKALLLSHMMRLRRSCCLSNKRHQMYSTANDDAISKILFTLNNTVNADDWEEHPCW